MTDTGPWWSRPSIEPYGRSMSDVVTRASHRDARTRDILDPRRPAPELQSEHMARLAYFSIYGEDVGGRAAEALLSVGLPPSLRASLVRAMWDEVRHAELFNTLSEHLDAPKDDWSPVLGLLDILDSATTELEFAVIHTELEALALDTFRVITDWGGDSKIGRVYAVVANDEAAHVRLGRDIAQHLQVRGLSIERERLIEILDATPELSFASDDRAMQSLAASTAMPESRVRARLRGRMLKRHARLIEEFTPAP